MGAWLHKSRSGSSPGTKSGGTLSLDVQPPEARETKLCCLPPYPRLRYLARAACTVQAANRTEEGCRVMTLCWTLQLRLPRRPMLSYFHSVKETHALTHTHAENF